jgi:hypothetical protein
LNTAVVADLAYAESTVCDGSTSSYNISSNNANVTLTLSAGGAQCAAAASSGGGGGGPIVSSGGGGGGGGGGPYILGPVIIPTTPAPTAPSTTPAPGHTSFTHDFTVGGKGSDVKALQQFLNTHGFPVAKSGLGSAGNETTFFGAGTKAALIKFQKANGITPAAGYFGPKTRAKINSL